MLALTIETTADDVALVLSEGERIVGAHYGRSSRQLDSEIFPALAQTLTEAGHRLDQIERLIVGRGPGSFVGTRIGMAVANSFATVLSTPVVGVDGFAALADIAGQHGHTDFLAAINCVREEVFYQAFTARDGAPVPQGTIGVAGFADFQEVAAGRPVVFRVTRLNRTLERDRVAAVTMRLSGASLLRSGDAAVECPPPCGRAMEQAAGWLELL